ncbi:MAG: thioredoxin family protein [Armatimonadota bacterium]|nr:thioredoxin family protein [Armatimonadota bacterium]
MRQLIPEQDKEFLKAKFADELENEVTVVAFTEKAENLELPGLECEFCKETAQLVDEVAELSDLIKVEHREYTPSDEMVAKLGIDKLPAIILMADSIKGIRYFGIPGGFEFSSLIEDIVDVSKNITDLSNEAKEKVRGINQDVHIQVFVTPTCPYCPSAVRIAHQMAIENPEHIVADAIEATEFPHLVSKYDISAVPTVVINDKVQFEGALPDYEFADKIAEALSA